MGALLAYAGWWLTGALVWFLERQDRYVRFHAAQSMIAFGAVALLIVVFGVSALASLSFLPRAFGLLVWATVVTGGVGALLWFVAIWHAARGQTWRIPGIARLADRLL